MSDLYRPGERAVRSGIYQMLKRNGSLVTDAEGIPLERTIVEGEPFPPTDETGTEYRLVTAAHHVEDARELA